jgi:hypothetical protein
MPLGTGDAGTALDVVANFPTVASSVVFVIVPMFMIDKPSDVLT